MEALDTYDSSPTDLQGTVGERISQLLAGLKRKDIHVCALLLLDSSVCIKTEVW